MSNGAGAIAYHAEIDGLRAIAVLAVVFYHLELGPLQGGFVGVDVFFVISGFLITSILNREIGQGRFSYARFYQRRVRRLFPALFVVLAATIAGGAALLLPSDFAILGKTLVATVLFASNVFLWRNSGYFDTSAELNPLLHTWSLAVEEQFYIGLPVLLLLLYRYSPKLVKHAVVIIGLASFALCVGLQSRRPLDTFYLAPFRAWELMAGSALALGLVPAAQQRWQRELLALGGLALIVYAVVRIPAGLAFPGWIAAIPVLGTAAVIHSGVSGDSWGRRALSLRPLVYTGLMSYSLYLWHWPLIVYAKYSNALEPLGLWRWVILAVSIAVSALSLRFIETPVRRGYVLAGAGPLFSRVGLASVAAALLGVVIAWGAGWPGRFPPDIIALDHDRSGQVPFLDCIDRPVTAVKDEGLCRIGAAEGRPTVLVWGDSHALAWLPAFDDLLAKESLGGLFASRSACPPLVGVRNPESPGCFDYNARVWELIHDDPSLRLVVLIAAWPSYSWERGKYTISDAAGRSGNTTVFPDAMRETLTGIDRTGKVAWLIGPTPGAPSDLPLLLALTRLHGGSDLERVTRVVRRATPEFRADLLGHSEERGNPRHRPDPLVLRRDRLPLREGRTSALPRRRTSQPTRCRLRRGSRRANFAGSDCSIAAGGESHAGTAERAKCDGTERRQVSG